MHPGRSGWHKVKRQRIDVKRHRRFVIDAIAIRQLAIVYELPHISESTLVPVQRHAQSGKPQSHIGDQDGSSSDHDHPARRLPDGTKVLILRRATLPFLDAQV